MTLIPDDEGIRLSTAQILSEQLARGSKFLTQAEQMFEQAGDTQAVAALSAAARLLRSNAALGTVLLKAAKVEDRRRVFHEQAAAPVELNPKFSKPKETPEEFEKRIEFRFNKTIAPHRRRYLHTKPEDYPPFFDVDDLDPSI